MKSDFETLDEYDEAIRLDPQANAYNNRGVAYVRLEQYGQAIEDYDEAIRLDPQYAKAYGNRSDAHEKLGQQELADRDYAKAVEIELKSFRER